MAMAVQKFQCKGSNSNQAFIDQFTDAEILKQLSRPDLVCFAFRRINIAEQDAPAASEAT